MAALKIVGVGNRFRSDDGAGPSVIDRLAARMPAGVLATSTGELTELLSWLADTNEVVIIDAVDAARPAGTVIRLDPINETLNEHGLRSNSHALGVVEAIEMARTLGKLPQRLSIIGIVGQHFGHGECLSRAVREAAARVADELLEAFAPAVLPGQG